MVCREQTSPEQKWKTTNNLFSSISPIFPINSRKTQLRHFYSFSCRYVLVLSSIPGLSDQTFFYVFNQADIYLSVKHPSSSAVLLCSIFSLLRHIAYPSLYLPMFDFLQVTPFSNGNFLDAYLIIYSIFSSQNSINLLHFPDNLLLKYGQNCIVVTDFLEHNAAVELVTNFLEVEPIVALFGKQLFKLAQSHHTALH